MKKTASLIAAAGIAALGLAACGSDDSSSDSSSTASGTATGAAATGGPTLTIATDPTELAFTKTDLTAKAGPTTIELNNVSSTEHELEVKSPDGEDVGEVHPISQGKGSFTADLKPGTYTFVCNQPGHAETMHGTINVE